MANVDTFVTLLLTESDELNSAYSVISHERMKCSANRLLVNELRTFSVLQCTFCTAHKGN